MNREQASELKVLQSIVPAVYSATKDDGTIIDTRGADAATVIVNWGAIVSAGDFAASIEEGDESDLSDGATAAAADLVGSFAATAVASSVEKVGYKGSKRYIRPVLTKAGGTSIAAAASVVLGKRDIVPVE
jgi:hypothetical protein